MTGHSAGSHDDIVEDVLTVLRSGQVITDHPIDEMKCNLWATSVNVTIESHEYYFM